MHTDTPVAALTDRAQIRRLYDDLLALTRSRVVALHRVIAVAEVDGPAAGLALAEQLDLGRYDVFHAARADLLRRPGRPAAEAGLVRPRLLRCPAHFRRRAAPQERRHHRRSGRRGARRPDGGARGVPVASRATDPRAATRGWSSRT